MRRIFYEPCTLDAQSGGVGYRVQSSTRSPGILWKWRRFLEPTAELLLKTDDGYPQRCVRQRIESGVENRILRLRSALDNREDICVKNWHPCPFVAGGRR